MFFNFIQPLKANLLLVIFSLCFMLSGCVTPTLTQDNNLCHQQTSAVNKSAVNTSSVNNSTKKEAQPCHYYDSTTPYVRRRWQDDSTVLVNKMEPDPTSNSLENEGPGLQTDLKAQFNVLNLSSGDRLNIVILNGEEFSSEVEVNADGFIYLPFIPAIKARGLKIESLKASIKQLLIDEQLMLAGTIRISITPLKWAPIEVSVSGAVFEPGTHFINHKSDTEITDDNGGHTGDQASGRSITSALRSSGGISPDADIGAITVTRGEQTLSLDLSGVIDGSSTPHLTLMAGDHIHVPQLNQFNDELARPSQITVPGIRVFISNLTQPASSNSQSAVDTEATRFPYGTRLLSGAIGANCIGGAQSTNASRHVILITKNPITKQIDVVERSLDNLMVHSWRPNMNPILLPGDGIACYDSGVTNIREIAKTFTEILLPATLLGLL
ncbi:polysaccharide export protein [Shewanella canadensis]|uniref:Polysaccharide export protein n=1 Tax=Shewanella canadensis TaxID=271096 RepID=A0A431WMS9_9GAMM|nr:polysaccharide biosynthesis/export family protein [Shewanella canadensis]RTR36737.1 polysaccharide export protein [Shewanella canadensis]